MIRSGLNLAVRARTRRDALAGMLRVAPANLVAAWPLDDAPGTAARDASGHGHAGTASNVTFGVAGCGDGRTAASFNGTTSVISMISAGLTAAFNGEQGSVGCWARVAALSVWTDATIRRFITLAVNAQNRVLLQKNSADGQLIPNYVAANVGKSATIATTTIAWFHLLTTWSKSADRVCHYLNGALQGSALTTLGAWAGSLATAVIGANDTTPTAVWSGRVAHVMLWDRALSASEVWAVYAAAAR